MLVIQAHDDPELRARVKAELLGPVKASDSVPLTAGQLQGIAGLYWMGRTVAYLSQRFGIPEAVIRDAVEEAA